MNQPQISLVIADVQSLCRDIYICNQSNLPLETSQWANMCARLMQIIGYTHLNHTAKCSLRVWMVVWGQVSFADR